jgi:hypothetical protein
VAPLHWLESLLFIVSLQFCQVHILNIFFDFFRTFLTITDHQPSPREACKEIISSWDGVTNRHIVLDAAFGSLELGKFLSQHKLTYTMSVSSSTVDRWLWDEMMHNLCTGKGRVMRNA